MTVLASIAAAFGVAALAVAFRLGVHFAVESARTAAADAASNAAAAGCPTCAQLVGPGARLGAIMGTVTRIEYSGAAQNDPVADANSLILTAAHHAHRVAANATSPRAIPGGKARGALHTR